MYGTNWQGEDGGRGLRSTLLPRRLLDDGEPELLDRLNELDELRGFDRFPNVRVRFEIVGSDDSELVSTSTGMSSSVGSSVTFSVNSLVSPGLGSTSRMSIAGPM